MSLELLGIGGAILYLASYAAVQYNPKFVETAAYSLMNVTAAGFVLLSLSEAWNLPSAIIQISWITISVYGLFRYAQRMRPKPGIVVAVEDAVEDIVEAVTHTETLAEAKVQKEIS